MMNIYVLLFTIGIISSNNKSVFSMKREDLEHLFYPFKLKISSGTQENININHNIKSTSERSFCFKSVSERVCKPSMEDGGHKNISEIIRPERVHFVLKEPDRDRPMMTAACQERLARSKEDRAPADDVGQRVRLLCWIMTYPVDHDKAMHVKETWGKRCDKLLFMSTELNAKLPTVKLDTREVYVRLWDKTVKAFQYIYDNYLNRAEWFMKADIDTYVVVENLKYLLQEYNANESIYLGSRFKHNMTKDGYMSGGAGYVLSREAVRRVVADGLSSELCKKNLSGSGEDLDLGICLDRVGVTLIDTRDKYKRGRFFPLSPQLTVHNKLSEDCWYWQYIYYPIKLGRSCCSEYTISFHFIKPDMMYALEYFTYHLRPYGITYSNLY